MDIYYRFTDRSEMLAALVASGVSDGHGVPAYHPNGAALAELGRVVATPPVLDEHGLISVPAEYASGWHLNVLGPEIAELADNRIPAPATPAWAWA